MKRLIKQALGRGIRRIREMVGPLDPEPVSYNAINPAFSYASLNRMLTELMAENPTVLYPVYTWGVLQSAHLARALGIPRISVLEFGVAGGNGLVALELAAEKIEGLLGVHISVYGFDTGEGMPKPTDYRDMPNLYQQSEYRMDRERLRQRLKRADLRLGLVATTVKTFVESGPAPIGFVSFDLDYYSSTVDAFTILEQQDYGLTLPRVHCYFDDIMGLSCSDFTGERLAIVEFNSKHERRKISPIFGLKYFLLPPFAREQWSEMIYLVHMFDHPLYGHSDGLTVNAQRPLLDVRP